MKRAEPGSPLPDQTVGESPRPPTRRRLARAVLFIAMGGTALFALRLVWQAQRGHAPSFDQWLAYASFLLVAAAGPIVLAVLLHRLEQPLPRVDRDRPAPLLSPFVVSVLLSIGLAATALLIYALGRDFVSHSVERRLQAVASLKSSLVKAWLDDVRDDIVLSADSPALHKAIELWQAAAPGDDAPRQLLVDHLWRLARTSHYVEISLRDPATGALLLTTTGDADTAEVRREAVAVARESAPRLEDFHVDAQRGHAPQFYLGYFAPVPRAAGHGPLVLHVGLDPKHELFPLIEQWPGSSETAEVLLLRREAESLVVLNDTRAPPGPGQDRRVPMNSPRYFASALARDGAGALQGHDDHDEAVLAYAVPLPGTGWFVVAKLNESEAFAELNRTALLAAAIVGALLLLGAWWWVENHRYRAVEQLRQHERAEEARRLAELSQRVVSIQEEERRRWSGELHDRVGANLAAIQMNLKAVARRLPPDSDEDRELLDETGALLGDTVASIREFCSELRPAMLDYGGLVPAIQACAAQFERRSGVPVRFEHAGFSGRRGAEIETMFFRIVQEALLNCAKHARPSRVAITLSSDAQQVRLSVEDDGAGFDPATIGQTQLAGLGLLNMRERASVVGGRFELSSMPGRGTRIVVEWAPPSGLAAAQGPAA